jgi:hypothetical protein
MNAQRRGLITVFTLLSLARPVGMLSARPPEGCDKGPSMVGRLEALRGRSWRTVTAEVAGKLWGGKTPIWDSADKGSDCTGTVTAEYVDRRIGNSCECCSILRFALSPQVQSTSCTERLTSLVISQAASSFDEAVATAQAILRAADVQEKERIDDRREWYSGEGPNAIDKQFTVRPLEGSEERKLWLQIEHSDRRWVVRAEQAVVE